METYKAGLTVSPTRDVRGKLPYHQSNRMRQATKRLWGIILSLSLTWPSATGPTCWPFCFASDGGRVVGTIRRSGLRDVGPGDHGLSGFLARHQRKGARKLAEPVDSGLYLKGLINFFSDMCYFRAPSHL